MLTRWVRSFLIFLVLVGCAGRGGDSLVMDAPQQVETGDTVYGEGIWIPITRTGSYRWESPQKEIFDVPPEGIGVDYRVIGDARITRLRGVPENAEGASRMVITFDVLDFAGEAYVEIIRAFSSATTPEDRP